MGSSTLGAPRGPQDSSPIFPLTTKELSLKEPVDAFEAALGVDREAWLAMNVERRAARAHEKIPDLGWFLTRGRDFAARPGAARSRDAARALFGALAGGPDGGSRQASL